MVAAYFNPYSHKTFFEVIFTFFCRMGSFLTGEFAFQDLASDEIQILVLMAVAASSALVGCFLVLRKMTMLANSLSHTILIGIVAAWLITGARGGEEGGLDLTSMLIAALITALLTTFLTQFLTRVVRLQEDASVGIVFTTLFALGVVMVTLFTRSTHIGLEVVMGNVDALHRDDLRLAGIIFLSNAFLMLLFYKEYKLISFDPALAKALGFSCLFFDYLLMTQVAATSVGAFRAVGVLMVLAFITGPPLTARLLTNRLGVMLLLSVAIGCLASLVGVAIARHLLSFEGLPISTAGIVVLVIASFYLMALLFSPRQGLISHLWRQDLTLKEY